MAKIVVTTIDANHIKVEFNDYYTNGVVGQKISFYNRTDLESVHVYTDLITVHVLNLSQDWQLSDVEDLSEGILQIDEIDATTSWADLTVLAAQIAGLIKA